MVTFWVIKRLEKREKEGRKVGITWVRGNRSKGEEYVRYSKSS